MRENNYLTREVAIQYYKKAMSIRKNSSQYIGDIKALQRELISKYKVTELEAVNILNGFHISDYVRKYEIKNGMCKVVLDENTLRANRELILKLAELEEKLQEKALLDENI